MRGALLLSNISRKVVMTKSRYEKCYAFFWIIGFRGMVPYYRGFSFFKEMTNTERLPLVGSFTN